MNTYFFWSGVAINLFAAVVLLWFGAILLFDNRHKNRVRKQVYKAFNYRHAKIEKAIQAAPGFHALFNSRADLEALKDEYIKPGAYPYYADKIKALYKVYYDKMERTKHLQYSAQR